MPRTNSTLVNTDRMSGLYAFALGLKTVGNLWFVDSNATTGGDTTLFGRSPNAPNLTLTFALSQCTANNGDVIFLLEGHAQTVASTTEFLVNVAGVTIVGLGTGADRPTFTLATNATAICNVTAASCTLKNVLILNTLDSVNCALQVNASDTKLYDVEVRDSGAVEMDRAVRILDSARVHVRGLVVKGEGTGDQAFSLLSIDGSDDCLIEDFLLDGCGSVGIIETTEDDQPLNLTLRRGIIRQRETAVAVAIDSDADVTGEIDQVDIFLTDNDTDLYGVIEAGGDWRVGTVRVCNGAEEGFVNIGPSLGNVANHNLIPSPWGGARVVTKSVTDHSAATVALFNVTVGKVLVLALTAEVTSALPANTDFSILVDNGAATALALATLLAVDSDEAKTMYGVTGQPSDALQIGLGAAPWCKCPVEVDALGGTTVIQLLIGDTGAASGATTWTLVYVPLERGATVAAA